MDSPWPNVSPDIQHRTRISHPSSFSHLEFAALLNVIETLMNLMYLYLAHVQHSPAAIVVAFAAIVMTLSKTVLYWAQEYYCGFCAVGHNNMRDLIILWIIPNGYVHLQV